MGFNGRSPGVLLAEEKPRTPKAHFLGIMTTPGRFEGKSSTGGTILCCQDCFEKGIFNDEEIWFMVHDELWEKYVPANGIICISCLEKRMGRVLTAEDFQRSTDGSNWINESLFLGIRIGARDQVRREMNRSDSYSKGEM